jgi:ADP-ribose pyrophosphatase
MDAKQRSVEIVSERRLLDDFFKVDEAQLRHEKFGGGMTDTIRRLSFERGDSVAVLILDTDSDELVLVEQFRYPTYHKGPAWLVEVVAGVLESDEDPEATVRREVLEETGYSVHRVEHIATFYLSPGGSSERILLYFAEVNASDRVAEGGGKSEEGEDIRLVRLRRDKIDGALKEARFSDAKTIIALQWLQSQASMREANRD